MEFWATAMFDHLDSLHRKFSGDASEFVAQLDGYCGLYWRFICTRLLQAHWVEGAGWGWGVGVGRGWRVGETTN